MLFSYPELQLLDSVTAQRDCVLDIVYSEVSFIFYSLIVSLFILSSLSELILL